MTIRIDTHINEEFGEYFISKNTDLKRTLHFLRSLQFAQVHGLCLK